MTSRISISSQLKASNIGCRSLNRPPILTHTYPKFYRHAFHNSTSVSSPLENNVSEPFGQGQICNLPFPMSEFVQTSLKNGSKKLRRRHKNSVGSSEMKHLKLTCL